MIGVLGATEQTGVPGPRINDRTNYISKLGENSDAFHRGSDSPLAICVDFHSEARINPTHFAEAASERSSSEVGRS